MSNHYIKKIVEAHKAGTPEGICSICSANEYVIEAAMEMALEEGKHVLIEATANQVNQFGGYTGMKPLDFKQFVFEIANKVGLAQNKVILGGDHLGPLTWKKEDSDSAMEKSQELIKQYVLAGFSKIHIDTSMHLANDFHGKLLETEIIANRGAILCRTAQETFSGLKMKQPEAIAPVYVVGSEVPIPGGSQREEEGIQVTKVSDFKNTVEAFHTAFMKQGLKEAWENVIAVVVQPGVEFGDETIHEYDREAAKDLTNELKEYPNLVFEGHSTDYQTAASLKKMVEDGIAILKVGPAVTFTLREALFSLNHIENELFKYNPKVIRSNFIDTLEKEMLTNPSEWEKHYHGDENKIAYARKYSLSDRCRYYLPTQKVQESMYQLINNLSLVNIPLTLIDQFMPIQYKKIRNGVLKNNPTALLKDRIKNLMDDYDEATSPEMKK